MKNKELSITSYFLIKGSFIGIAISNIITISKQDSWISIILGFILGFIPLLLYSYFIDQNIRINDLIVKIFGKSIGNIILVLLLLFSIFFASINLWNLSNFIGYQYLYKTPTWIISVLFMIPVIYALYKNIKVIGRIHIIFFYLSLILVFITIIFIFTPFRIQDLLPSFEYGYIPILKGSLLSIGYNILPLFFLTIIQKENEKITKSLIKVYSFTYIILGIVMISTIGIFGYKLANLYQYPEYHLLKTINIGNFLKRLETPLSIQWLFDLLVSISIPIYFASTIIKENLKINKKIIPLIIGIIIIIISKNLFSSNTQAHTFLLNTYPFLLFSFLFIIPLLIFLVFQFRRNKIANN